MAKIIKGNQDGKNVRNETYSIPGRSSRIKRNIIVNEVKQGKYDDYQIYEYNKNKFIRSNPDGIKKNNINN